MNKLKRAIWSLDDPRQIAAAKPLEKVPKWIAGTAAGRTRQLQSLRQAKRELLNKIRDNRKAHSRYRRDEAKLVVSPADPEAVVGRDKHDVVQPLYNIQYMTDCQGDVILSSEVFRQKSDNTTLGPMIEQCDFDFDRSTGELRCPGGHGMKLVRTVEVPRAWGRTVPELRFEQSEENCSGCPLAAKCLSDGSKLHRDQARQHGRGLSRVRAEVGLLALAQNTLTLYNREKRSENASL